MIERAYAKLNLTLDVLGKNPDGYHDMRMVMQSVEFGDDIDITLTSDGSFTLDPGQPWLPSDDRNLVMRAAKLFLDGTGLGADMHVTKRTPVCAGMAGGSSDAAAVLRALNTLTGSRKSAAELCVMALQIGSDVPFCVQGGTALAEGRGEILTQLPAMPDCHIVICKPDFAISTPELFAELDRTRRRLHPDTAGMIEALKDADIAAVSRRCFNVFTDALNHRRRDIITDICSSLVDLGALGAAMTGTGSAVFGLFDNTDTAAAAQTALHARYTECWLTKPSPRIEIHG